jgi:hypothetical protein
LSSSGNQLFEYVKQFVPSGPETGKKLHQTYCFLRKAAQPSRPDGEGVAVVVERNGKKIPTCHKKLPNSCPAKLGRETDGFLDKKQKAPKMNTQTLRAVSY